MRPLIVSYPTFELWLVAAATEQLVPATQSTSVDSHATTTIGPTDSEPATATVIVDPNNSDAAQLSAIATDTIDLNNSDALTVNPGLPLPS